MRILLLVVALLVLAGVVLAASAKLDTPSQSSTVNRVIDAPRETVWAALVDLDSYGLEPVHHRGERRPRGGEGAPPR